MSGELTQHEATELDRCEIVIEKGIKTFVAVGKALLEIRDDKLYRTTYPTFEDYCQQRWQLDRRYAYRIMDSARVHAALDATETDRSTSEMSPIGDKPHNEPDVWPMGHKPASERQARPLAALLPKPDASPAERKRAEQDIGETWREAVETAPRGTDGQPKVTAAHVADTVARRTAADAIGEQMAPAPSNAELDEQLERARENTPARFRANYSEAMTRAMKILGFSRSRIVEVVDHDSLRGDIRELRRWCDEVEDQMKPNLRVVGGDR